MKSAQKKLKIAVVEDDNFFNRVVTRQLETHVDALAINSKFAFEILSYTNPIEFLEELDPETEIAFIDYYVGHGLNGSVIIKRLKKFAPKCKIVVISGVKSFRTAIKSKALGASKFIFKDSYAMAKTCLFVDEHVLRLSQSTEAA